MRIYLRVHLNALEVKREEHIWRTTDTSDAGGEVKGSEEAGA